MKSLDRLVLEKRATCAGCSYAKRLRLYRQQRQSLGELSRLAANDVKSAEMLTALNDLMKKGKVVACPGMDKALVFRLQSDEDAAKMRDLTAEDRLVYQEIEQSQNKGASTKDLRSKTGLQAPALTKALKKLETRKLVRQVKSVASKNTKIYMLIDLEPGREITGGALGLGHGWP